MYFLLRDCMGVQFGLWMYKKVYIFYFTPAIIFYHLGDFSSYSFSYLFWVPICFLTYGKRVICVNISVREKTTFCSQNDIFSSDFFSGCLPISDVIILMRYSCEIGQRKKSLGVEKGREFWNPCAKIF